MAVAATELTTDELAERLAALRGSSPDAAVGEVSARLHGEAVDQPSRDGTSYRYVKPLSAAAHGLIEVFRNIDGRFMSGLKEIDLMTRGIGPGELCYLTGRSHSGKTQVFLQMVLHNLERPIVLFTPDETAEMVLSKLVSMLTASNAERIEWLVQQGDEDAANRIVNLAETKLSNLVVIDEVIDLGQMAQAMVEARDYFGREVAAVGMDYLGLLADGDDYSDIGSKSKALKRWTKDQNVPVICVHQGTRTNAGKGQKLGLEAMAYAGENEATFVVGVRRLRDDESLDDWERERYFDTVNVAVIKNKRPPSKRGEVTYWLDPESGIIRPLRDDDLRPKPAPDPTPDDVDAALELW